MAQAAAGTDYGPSATSDQAVEETAGQVLWYENQLAETYYSSSHGGASESAYNVWGTNMDNYPYLCGVEDPYEQLVADSNPYSSWTVTYTASELQSRLRSYGLGNNTTLDYMELTYSQLGNVIQVTFHWANGQTNTISQRSSSTIKGVFGLRSIRFTVNGQTVTPGEAPPERRAATRSTARRTSPAWTGAHHLRPGHGDPGRGGPVCHLGLRGHLAAGAGERRLGLQPGGREGHRLRGHLRV